MGDIRLWPANGAIAVYYDDLGLPLDRAADGYRAMDERRAVKVLPYP